MCRRSAFSLVAEIEGIPEAWQNLKGKHITSGGLIGEPRVNEFMSRTSMGLAGSFPKPSTAVIATRIWPPIFWRMLDAAQLAEVIRRLIFNAAIGNNDMHLKNWSLIYPDGRTPRLAPAYDFVSTIRYITDNRMALSVAKEKSTDRLTVELLERDRPKGPGSDSARASDSTRNRREGAYAVAEDAEGASIRPQNARPHH